MNKLILVLACGVGVVTAQEKKAAAEPKPAEKAAQAVGQSGMRVFKDPETGELRAPTAAEKQALQQSLSIAAGAEAPVQIVTNPDGSLTANLGPAYMTYSVVRKTPAGALVVDCVTGEKKAAAFLYATKAPVDLSNKLIVTERPNEK